VYFYHDGQNWSEHQVPEDGQATEYPAYTMNYNLHVVQRDGSTIDRTVLITVNPASEGVPVIEYLSATPPEITLGQTVGVDWKVSGGVHQVQLYVDDVVVLDPAPVQGNYPDTPSASGTRVYKLIATGPGGEDTRQVRVNVQAQPTEAPEPEEPTPTPEPVIPTPTLEPVIPTPTPEPEPQPPVIQGFTVTPATITPGQSVTAAWTTGGGATYVQLLRNGQVIWEDTALNNAVPDAPPDGAGSTVRYTLIAYNNAEQTDIREVFVEVVDTPVQSMLVAPGSQTPLAW
jgi:hypothetical protein